MNKINVFLLSLLIWWCLPKHTQACLENVAYRQDADVLDVVLECQLALRETMMKDASVVASVLLSPPSTTPPELLRSLRLDLFAIALNIGRVEVLIEALRERSLKDKLEL